MKLLGRCLYNLCTATKKYLSKYFDLYLYLYFKAIWRYLLVVPTDLRMDPFYIKVFWSDYPLPLEMPLNKFIHMKNVELYCIIIFSEDECKNVWFWMNLFHIKVLGSDSHSNILSKPNPRKHMLESFIFLAIQPQQCLHNTTWPPLLCAFLKEHLYSNSTEEHWEKSFLKLTFSNSKDNLQTKP